MLISPILFKLIHHPLRVLALLCVSSVAEKSIRLGLHPKVAAFTLDLISCHTAWYTLTLPPMVLATNTGKLEFNISHALGFKIIELKTP
jgi:ABC-type anion transport system duplicated permease subunit